tara:strand:- start:719 stop:1720 length:1002 start_codon:yes stop_codon:yes gene_type:complete
MISNIDKLNKIFIAGHNGMVGSAIIRKLKSSGVSDDCIITKNKNELDLTNQSSVNSFFNSESISCIFLAAAKVGGIIANNNMPAEFIYDNILIQSNIINAAYKKNVKRLIFLGSSCIYPKNAKQPIKENEFLNGHLEPTNRPYAVAKISGIEMIWAYNRQFTDSSITKSIAIMPSNLYGKNDNYDLENSHVIPGLIHKFHAAKKNKDDFVTVWGTGKPLREFTSVDDLADACLFLLDLNKEEFNDISAYNRNSGLPPIINAGSGKEVTIKQLSEIISEVVGFKGNIKFDTSMPDGTMRKIIDSSRINKLGWKPKTELKIGIYEAYQDFLAINT